MPYIVSAFDWFVVGASVIGGFVGSISGFGIGTFVTPVVAAVAGTKLAVAIVSLPHFVGTAIRFWTLRYSVNRRVLSNRWRFGRRIAWFAGALSGVFGGMVGNQGGIRAAAMLGFDLKPSEFIATATAVALMVDLGRLPVYLTSEWALLRQSGAWIVLSMSGVVAGTIVGLVTLSHVPEARFRKIVSAIVLALGVYMLMTIFRSADP